MSCTFWELCLFRCLFREFAVYIPWWVFSFQRRLWGRGFLFSLWVLKVTFENLPGCPSVFGSLQNCCQLLVLVTQFVSFALSKPTQKPLSEWTVYYFWWGWIRDFWKDFRFVRFKQLFLRCLSFVFQTAKLTPALPVP